MATVAFDSCDAGVVFGPGTCLGPARSSDSQAHRRAHAVADALLRASERSSTADATPDGDGFVPVEHAPLLHAAPGFPKGALSACFRRQRAADGSAPTPTSAASSAASASAASTAAIQDVLASLTLAKAAGNSHFAAGAFKEAVATYRDGLREARPAATHVAAELALGTGDRSAAAALHRLVVTLQVNAAVCSYRDGDFRGCDRYCTRAIGLCRVHPKALMFRARARLALGDAEAALADCRELEALLAAAHILDVNCAAAQTSGEGTPDDAAADFHAVLAKAAAQAGAECAELKAAATAARLAEREQAGRGLRGAFGGR